MAGAVAKVVRVEQVMDDAQSESSLLPSDVFSQDVKKTMQTVPAPTNEQNLQVIESPEDDTAETDVSNVASQAVALPMPEGWPKIAKLQDKQSWDYSTTISPSVNKATSHLELLQTIIEEWFRDSQTGSRGRTASSVRPKTLRSHGAGEPKGGRKSMSFGASHVVDHVVSDGSSVSTPQLSIHGVGGIDTRDKKTTIVDPAPSETSTDAAYLGAEEVMEEVITLLAKMESDRTDTLAAMKAERERVITLQSKIDSLSTQRMVDLPISVQKEHEDCAMDISELNWHVSYRRRILERNNHKVSVAEALNKRTKEEISFVNKHIPLVVEKLDLEVDAMDRIKQAQIDTNEELDITLQRCGRVEEKAAEAQAKADQERAAIKADLDSVRDDLTKICEELSEAKMTYNTYTHKCNDYRQQLQDNDQELAVQLVKDENIRAAEEMQAAKVRELETHLKRADFERKTLSEENEKLQARLDYTKAKCDKKENELRQMMAEKEEALKLLTRENDELDMDVEDLDNKVQDCDRQKIADEKNLERMARELERTEDQINMTLDDLGNVSIINNATRDQLEKEEERCLQSEEALRSTTEALKKQVKEEIHSRTVLIARIHADSSDLMKAQEEGQLKKDLVTKKLNEVNKAVNIVLAKVEKLRSFHKEKTKMISDFNEELRKIAEAKRVIGETCDKQREELIPKHRQHKESLTKVEKQLDHMEFKTEMMNKKIQEMDESSAMMIKSLTKTNTIIAQLEADLEELNIQIETGQAMADGLDKSHKQVLGHLEENDRLHKEHMADRNKVLFDHEASLEYNVALNREMAARYRHLQNHFVAVKNQMLNKYDNRVKLENAVKDLKQLKVLQLRMHTALMEYLKLRGLYNEGELQRMEGESHCNGVRVTSLQGQMDTALDMISSFLTHQLDGDTIRKMAMDKVEREERSAAGAAGGNAGSTIVTPGTGTKAPPIQTSISVS